MPIILISILISSILIYKVLLLQKTLSIKDNDVLAKINEINLLKNQIEIIKIEKDSLEKINLSRINDLEKIIQSQKETILQKDQTLNEQIKNLISNEFQTFNKNNLDIKENLIKDNINQINNIANNITEKLSATVSKHNVIIDQVIKENKLIANAFLGSNSAGQLGESLLQSKLESLGMIENEHFITQLQGFNEGNKFIPDFVLLLPNQQFIIIDSKTSISMIQESDDKSKLISAIKDTIKRYSQKTDNYLTSTAESLKKKFNQEYTSNLSFCLMYLPSEKIIDEINQIDNKILTDAYSKNIVICGPTSINAILQFAIYNIDTARHQKNSMQNSKLINSIAEDLIKMNNIMTELGKQIEKSVDSYYKIGKIWSKNILKPLKTLREYLNSNSEIKEIEIKEKEIEEEKPKTLDLFRE